MNPVFKAVLLSVSAVMLLAAPAAAQEPPAAPSDLAATVLDGPQVQLTWTDNSSNENDFLIYRSLSAEGPFDWWDVVPGDTTTYTDMYSLVGGPIYYYQVTALDEINWLESTPSNTAEADLPVGVPRAPSAFEATCSGRDTVVYMAWEDASWNEDEFVISMSANGINGNYYDITAQPANSGCYVHYCERPTSTVYYKIRTRNTYGSSACVGPVEVHTGEWGY